MNRASPRTQSALLEAMAENQVSIEGERYPMDELFFVIATQNPIEFHGTYPLPEAQMDRFAFCFELGYVSREDELEILNSQQGSHPLNDLEPCLDLNDIIKIRHAASSVVISDEIKGYIVDLVSATRQHPAIQMGASPRAGLTLMKSAQALALVAGEGSSPLDSYRNSPSPPSAHRLALNPDARYAGTEPRQVVQEVLDDVDVPV
ncbi:MAG: MoxR family ATPase [Gammaproteobacteria bacterium]|nr:MoxR family ATPase [Gammaproteobacteria bacterium]